MMQIDANLSINPFFAHRYIQLHVPILYHLVMPKSSAPHKHDSPSNRLPLRTLHDDQNIRIQISGHDDAVLCRRIGQNLGIGGAPQLGVVDINRIEAERPAEMRGRHRRQILVDQEARRHGFPAGRPRNGLALA